MLRVVLLPASCDLAITTAAALLVVEFFMYGFVEGKRWMDFRKPGSQAETGSFLGFEGAFKGTDNGYPGGPFDPLGLTR